MSVISMGVRYFPRYFSVVSQVRRFKVGQRLQRDNCCWLLQIGWQTFIGLCVTVNLLLSGRLSDHDAGVLDV